ncbi:hypothetical protein AAE02nite_36030 [Adhaeribacter aerolatus]|uniref:Kinase n=1 Tax=Adhaeribacter aerolatus TaxID=670289 RepID=A0A512B1X2_9BACT|nr:AAA family ATPase [Adhaeribacter aerolatus]GEO05939.1 hypothetical protein AAE02nite_36030 [Adhaeribacter aerolatus]
MQAIIFCGIQATGKTTFYKENFLQSHVRISLDLLRTRHRENIFLEACLQTRQRFVVDNTNPTALERAKYIQLAQAAGYEIVGYYFKSNVQEAVVRNMERTGKARVPEVGIFGTRKRLEVPSYAEGFNALFYVQALGAGAFNLRTWEENNNSGS